MNTEITPTLEDFAVAERLLRAGYDEGRGLTDGLNNLVAGQIVASHRLASHSASAARIEKLEGALRAHQDYIRYLHDADRMTAGFLHVHNWSYDADFIQRGNALRAALNPEETKGGGQ